MKIMRLSISNIGWNEEQDSKVYELMRNNGFSGLEIAPTRVFPEAPYDRVEDASLWSAMLKATFGFAVPSMQSIWFGRTERIFSSKAERDSLIEYTKKAIDFAVAVNCHNLVFGCPKNRVLLDGADEQIGIEFFKEIGDYAVTKGTVIGIEANPPIYNTNYINDTVTALKMIERVNSKGFLLNLDAGTMIYNKETVSVLKGKVKLINHVHISEPGLKPIEERKIHSELRDVLKEEGYSHYVSIEMGRVNDLKLLNEAMEYVREIFE